MKISLSHVSKYYQDGEKATKGLEDITLSFETDSSFVVITGESGAGKTTLFRLLTGSEDFDEGEITFDDKPLSGVSDEERAKLYRENIAFDFQEYNLIEGFTPIENIVLSLTKSGYGLKEAKKKASEVLDQVGLKKQKKMRVSKLSGGERQRVAIARCLASDAKVLLFDEPTGNLDPETSKEIVKLIESLQENRLILYITHDFDLVRNKATRHIVLADGHVVSDEILKTDASKEEKEEPIVKHPTKAKSTLYTSFLFAIKRPARTLMTVLILLFCSSYLYFGAVGTASMRDMASGAFYNNQTYQIGHGFGNEVTVLKNAAGDFSTEESSDVYYDNLDLEKDFNSYLSLGDDFDTALKNVSKTSSDSNYAYAVNLTYVPYAPSKIKRTLFEAKETRTDAIPVTVYLSDSQGKNSSLYSTLEVRGFQTDVFHLIPIILYQNYFHYEQNTDASVLEERSFTLKGVMEKVDKVAYLDKVITYDSGTDATDGLFSFSEDQDRKDYGDVVENTLLPFLDYEGSYSYPSDSTLGNILNPKVSLSYGGKYLRFNQYLPSMVGREEYGDKHFYLSEQFKGKLSSLSLTYNNAVLSLKDVPEKDVVYFSSSEVANPYLCYYSRTTLYNLAKEQKAYGRFYTRNPSEVKDLESRLSENKNLSVTEIEAQHTETVRGDSKGAISDISSRIADLFTVLALVLGFLIILFLVRLLLSRFYYRKDSDEKVLRDIGYTDKDLYLNNALQFVFLMVLCIVVSHLVFTFTIPQFVGYYVNHTLLFVLAIVLSLAVSFYVSLPSRRQHKRKERHHD